MGGSRWSCRDAFPGLDGVLTQGTKQRAVEIEGVRGTGRKTRASQSDGCSWSDDGSWSEELEKGHVSSKSGPEARGWPGHKTPH